MRDVQVTYWDGLDGVSIGHTNERLVEVVGGNFALQILDVKVPQDLDCGTGLGIEGSGGVPAESK